MYDILITMYYYSTKLFITINNDLVNFSVIITKFHFSNFMETLLAVINTNTTDLVSVPSQLITELHEMGTIIQAMTILLGIGTVLYTVGYVLGDHMHDSNSSESSNKPHSFFTDLISIVTALLKFLGVMCFLTIGYMLVYLVTYTI